MGVGRKEEKKNEYLAVCLHIIENHIILGLFDIDRSHDLSHVSFFVAACCWCCFAVVVVVVVCCFETKK